MEDTGKRTDQPTQAAASAAKVASVLDDDDLLHEILLRLDFPSCLVRAAAVSKRWLRHASDPAFLRRFRARHPPRLLGLYVRPVRVASNCCVKLFPELFFVPMPQSPAESAAVIGRGSFQVDNDGFGVWDCRNGLVAFDGGYGVDLFSPLHPMRGTAAAGFPDLQDLAGSWYGRWFHYKFVLLPEDGGDGTSCTAVTLMINHRAARAHLSELQAGVWCQEGRISDMIELPQRLKTVLPPLLAHGKFYMVCMAGYILALDPDSLPISLFCIKLPDGVEYNKNHTNVALCRAEGSGFFLVHVKMSRVYVWTHSTSCRSSIGDWKLVDSICLRQVFGHLEDPSFRLSQDDVVRVAAAGDNADFVILEIDHKLFCVHIRSRAVEKVLESPTFQPGLQVHPFMMVWPPTFPKWSDGRELGVE